MNKKRIKVADVLNISDLKVGERAILRLLDGRMVKTSPVVHYACHRFEGRFYVTIITEHSIYEI